MLKGLERIDIPPSGGPKAGPECGNCGACPLAGRCHRRLTVIKFKGLASKSAKLVTSTADMFADQGLKRGVFVFGSVDGGRPISSEASEKTCSKCGKNPDTCLHPERNYKAA